VTFGSNVLVVGAGVAGWTAAVRAAECGADVLLVDKSSDALGHGNSLMTSGSFQAAGRNPKSDPTELLRLVMKEGVAYPELAWAWSENCARAADWLVACGIDTTVTKTGQMIIEPRSSVSFSPVYRRDVGVNALKKLKERFLKLGGSYKSGVGAVHLTAKKPHQVEGVLSEHNGEQLELKSKATILTTGGFSANKEMLLKYIGRHADACKLRGSTSCTGDGLRMALELGAKAVNLSYFYGHLLSLKAITDDKFWPYPRLDSLVSSGILVNRSGNRFVDEGRGDVAVANELARRDDVRGACLIFDQQAWDNAVSRADSPLANLPSPNPWLLENDGYLYRREAVTDLAQDLGVDGVNLRRTLEDFNRACEQRNPAGISVPRTGEPGPIRSPLYGLKVVPGITFTMGGVLINRRAEVLSLEERAITGLYAAGDVIGGLMGGFNGGYTGGLSQAVVTGILAGENAAKFVLVG
jgi:fumarate reductase flavoprotein subunit